MKLGEGTRRAFDDADVENARERLLTFADRLPGVEVGEGHGSMALLLRGTRFAWFVVDHHGSGILGFWVRSTREEQQALTTADPGRYFVPPYLGPRGWIGAYVDPGADPDWEELGGLLEQAWRMGATKKAIAAFDAAQP